MHNQNPEHYYSKPWKELTVLDRVYIEEMQVLKILDGESIENLRNGNGLRVVLGICKLKPAVVEAKLFLESEDENGCCTGVGFFDPRYFKKYGLGICLFYKVDKNSEIENGTNYDWSDMHDELVEVIRKNKPYLFPEYWKSEE